MPDFEFGDPTPTAGFDVAGRAFEEAKRDPVGPHGPDPGPNRAPRWLVWAVTGGVALAAIGFIADRGWDRQTGPYASWYWPDQAQGLQVPAYGTRWVLDPRQRSVAIADEAMAPAGTFNGTTYYAPTGGGGGAGAELGPVYLRVAPGRYLPLVEGGLTADQLRRQMLEGNP